MRIKLDDNKQIKSLLRQLLTETLNKDPSVCGLCGEKCKTMIHHTKYDGATLYDLLLICNSCNNLKANRGIA